MRDDALSAAGGHSHRGRQLISALTHPYQQPLTLMFVPRGHLEVLVNTVCRTEQPQSAGEALNAPKENTNHQFYPSRGEYWCRQEHYLNVTLFPTLIPQKCNSKQNCVQANAGVFVQRRNGDRWLRFPQITRRSLLVCSVLSVFLPAYACFSPQRPGSVLRPLMDAQRRAPADNTQP